MLSTSKHKLIQDELHQLDLFFNEHLHSHVAVIEQMCQHIMKQGGKRIRAKIVILIANGLGYQGKKHIDLAAIVELLHAATLLHDDVIDDASIRRHKKTINHLWGNTPAILGGDFLYGLAFQQISTLENHAICSSIARATTTIIEGEMLQLMAKNNPDYSLEQYFKIIDYKTARLFKICGQIPGLLTQCASEALEQLNLFGHHFGMAYQILDDLKDYFSDSSTLGKKIGNDLAEGKITLPTILAYQNGSSTQQQQLREIFATHDTSLINEVIAMILQTNSQQISVNYLKQHLQKAAEALSSLKPNSYIDSLLNMINDLTQQAETLIQNSSN